MSTSNSTPETPQASPHIDLHSHTTASDGVYSPTELIELARQAGITTLGVTDHDTTDGLEEAIEAGAARGVRVVPGIEINTDLPNKGGEAHVLGYFIKWENVGLQRSIAILREARAHRGERIVENLRATGVDITWDRVRELAKGAVGRPHVAAALIEAGYAQTVPEAFERYLVPGRPGYMPRFRLSPEDAVRLIRSAHGIPVLAHPAGIPNLETELLPSLVMAGLQGLECYYGEYDAATEERLLNLADQYGLIPTGGSDYHGEGIHPTPLGGHPVPASSFERLERTAEFQHRLPVQAFEVQAPVPEAEG